MRWTGRRGAEPASVAPIPAGGADTDRSPTTPMPVGTVLELRGVAARAGGRTLWQGLDLTIGESEFVAVLGPNGVGKSTLLKILLGLHPTGAGEVRNCGHPVRRANHQVGYVPQRRSFEPSVRIRGVDLVRLGLDGDQWGVPLPRRLSRGGGRAQAVRVAQVVEMVGAAAYAHRPIGELSGGEQQRLLIAQALARQPRLLLLDEPLDSLDLPNQRTIAALIGRICRQHGVSVLMATHDVNPILDYTDRIIYLARGGTVVGRPDEVISDTRLSRLYGTPVEVFRTETGRLVVVVDSEVLDGDVPDGRVGSEDNHAAG